MDQLTGEMLTSGGMIGLLAVGIVAFVRGWIVPRIAVDELRADRDAWRRAAEAETMAREAMSHQLDEVLTLLREDVAWHRSHP